MRRKEFEFILSDGEGQYIEFKESLNSSLSKEIIGFANASGGRIFLGINDNSEIKGIKVTNKLKSQIQDLARNCDPSVFVKLEEFENVLIINIMEGENKHYSCKEGFYLRVGPNSQKMRRDEIMKLAVKEGKVRFDEQICRDFDWKDFDEEKFDKKELIENTKLFHNQIYKFQYHRAKLGFILEEEFRHFRFKPVREFLELVVAECPHHIFRSNEKRASEFKGEFNLEQAKISSKNNFIVKIANFVVQAISNNKLRHEILQDFMISNDSVTVATEVPVLIDSDDLRHYKHELNFDIPIDLNDGEYITGHIDLVQIRNGLIYIMDFKPSAKKEKPIEQLTIYALALSRLTGIRLYHFRCAWFDKENYFEFFPLHVVHKKKSRSRKRKKNYPKISDTFGDEEKSGAFFQTNAGGEI